MSFSVSIHTTDEGVVVELTSSAAGAKARRRRYLSASELPSHLADPSYREISIAAASIGLIESLPLYHDALNTTSTAHSTRRGQKIASPRHADASAPDRSSTAAPHGNSLCHSIPASPGAEPSSSFLTASSPERVTERTHEDNDEGPLDHAVEHEHLVPLVVPLDALPATAGHVSTVTLAHGHYTIFTSPWTGAPLGIATLNKDGHGVNMIWLWESEFSLAVASTVST